MADENDIGTQTPPALPQPGAPGAPAQPPAPPRRPVLAAALPEEALLAKKLKWQQEAREAALRELGVDDPEKWRAEQAALRSAAEEKKRIDDEAARAKLDERGRYEADLKARDARIAELEQLAETKAKEALTKGVELLAREAAVEVIDPSMYPYARNALKDHIASLPERERRRFDDDDAKEFFKKLAKDKPGFAKRSAPVPAKGAPPVLRRALTTGPAPARTTVPAGTQPKVADAKGGKTAAPGKPNSMTSEEVRAEFKSMGVDYRPYGGGAREVRRANGAAGPPALGATAATGARPTSK